MRIEGAYRRKLQRNQGHPNNGSIAHPSDDLLGEPEAHLAANATRTIFNYIRAKVRH